ncbi:hypothetical protein BC830DRAFT_1146852 [Chytriomyces sp. MP71]|nr:hypothetical protein BC830DRAFT_1146852 [Chytriomyces sp. MP71]
MKTETSAVPAAAPSSSSSTSDLQVPHPKRTTKFGKEYLKNKKGSNQNKQRSNYTGVDQIKFCALMATSGECSYGPECRFSHDADAYLASKGPDLDGVCRNFAELGKCKFGIRCRWAMSHSSFDEATKKWNFNVTDEAKVALVGTSKDELNWASKKGLDAAKKVHGSSSNSRAKWKQTDRSQGEGMPEPVKDVHDWTEANRQYNQYKDKLMKEAIQVLKSAKNADVSDSILEKIPDDVETETRYVDQFEKALPHMPAETSLLYREKTRKNEEDEAAFRQRFRDEETPKFKWEGTYMAPLTTVGNLPFRRIAKDFGVDITCAEMAMSNNIQNMAPHEWALLRRHPCEDKFGIQVAVATGSSAANMGHVLNTRLFEDPENHHPTLKPFDFIDINCGCPIDLVFKAGAGSALMSKRNRLKEAIAGLRRTLPVPVSVKLRTGISDASNLAHKLIPLVASWGASAVTLHGRSRAQRYTRNADWPYIEQCAQIARASGIPLYGNGDVLGFEDYYARMPGGGTELVDGVMVGRGALIKPWIFKEIKEQAVYDIRGNERLEIFQTFANYGLDHWGSDNKGVNITRTYLLEWMSFTHRYIPVGLLEVLPQKFNERPPPFVGRDHLETLLASPRVSDWIHVTEMILGKAPNDFTFTPKHKSNSYEGDAGREEEAVHG